MKKMVETVSSGIILIISLIKGFLNKRKYPKGVLQKEPKALVTFAGILGDGILFLDALDALETIYTNEKQGSIEFAIKPAVYQLYKEIGILDKSQFSKFGFIKDRKRKK